MERIKICLGKLVSKNAFKQNTEESVLSNLESASFLKKIGVSKEQVRGKLNNKKK